MYAKKIERSARVHNARLHQADLLGLGCWPLCLSTGGLSSCFIVCLMTSRPAAQRGRLAAACGVLKLLAAVQMIAARPRRSAAIGLHQTRNFICCRQASSGSGRYSGRRKTALPPRPFARTGSAARRAEWHRMLIEAPPQPNTRRHGRPLILGRPASRFGELICAPQVET